MTLAFNRIRGKMAEDSYVLSRTMQGYEVKRRAHGSDYSERKVNLLTGRKGPETLIEIKSSNTAPVSELQRKTKKKTQRYRVVRYGEI